MIRAATAVILGGFCALSCFAGDTSQANVVKQFFPERLRTGSDLTAGLKPGSLRSEYAATDFDKSNNANEGRKFLVAVYGNAWEGAVRVIHRVGDDWVLAAEVPIRSGSVRGVELRDLDGDGTPEVLARFGTSLGRYEGTWVFRWTGSSLVSLVNAPDDSQARTNPDELYVHDYADLYGDGQTEIISRTIVHDGRDVADGEEPPQDGLAFSVYKLKDGYYQLWKDLIGYKFFIPHGRRDAGTYPYSFPATNTAAHYALRLVRSGFSKSWSIKSATIRLNGVVVADDSLFRQKLPVILVPVGLQAENTLTVSDLVIDGDDSTRGQDIPCLVISVETQ